MANPDRLAFVCPRLAGDGAVGGAETLLKNLALHAVRLGFEVDFLTTCAQSHFTWENTLPPGTREMDGMTVHFFPVDARDAGAFLRIQQTIDRGGPVSEQEEQLWLRNGVHSTALLEHLAQHATRYRAILLGPYLFGLTWFTALAHPERSLLIPCLHDEPFARLSSMKRLFAETAGCLFNSQAERELARELFQYPDHKSRIVGMGLEPFTANPLAFAQRHHIRAPYVLYSGRREPLKGTRCFAITSTPSVSAPRATSNWCSPAPAKLTRRRNCARIFWMSASSAKRKNMKPWPALSPSSIPP